MDIKIGNTITVIIPFKRLGIDIDSDIKFASGSFVIRDPKHKHHKVPVLSPTDYTIRDYGFPIYNKMPVNAHCCAENHLHGFSVYKDTDPVIKDGNIVITYPGYIQHTTGEFDVVVDVILSHRDGRIVKTFNNLFVLSENNYTTNEDTDIDISNRVYGTIINDKRMYNNIIIYNKSLMTNGTIDNVTLNLTR